MSALLDRIRFLAKNPEVEQQSFNVSEAAEFLDMHDRTIRARSLLIACISSAADAMDKAERITDADPELRLLNLTSALETIHSLSAPRTRK